MSLRRAFTLVELLVVVAIIGILLALLLPGVQSAREVARRNHCLNNLRQIGLGLHHFHGSHRAFPASGWTTAGIGNPSGKFVGWRALTLPFIEQESLQQLYDFDQNWWEGTNATVAAVPVKTFLCPSVPQRRDVMSAIAKTPRPALSFANPVAPTDYEAIMGVQPAAINPHLPSPTYHAGNRFSAMSRNSRSRIDDVLDGTSSTILIVECGARPLTFRNKSAMSAMSNDQGICWADSEGPFSLDGASVDGASEGCGPPCNAAMNKKNDNEPFGFHPGGCNVLFVDGHAQFLRETTALPVFAALCTMNAGETVSADP